jgi:hypothetical protein
LQFCNGLIAEKHRGRRNVSGSGSQQGGQMEPKRLNLDDLFISKFTYSFDAFIKDLSKLKTKYTISDIVLMFRQPFIKNLYGVNR